MSRSHAWRCSEQESAPVATSPPGGSHRSVQGVESRREKADGAKPRVCRRTRPEGGRWTRRPGRTEHSRRLAEARGAFGAPLSKSGRAKLARRTASPSVGRTPSRPPWRLQALSSQRRRPGRRRNWCTRRRSSTSRWGGLGCSAGAVRLQLSPRAVDTRLWLPRWERQRCP
jgi:hypothetical protein